jgi:hypothetical protein
VRSTTAVCLAVAVLLVTVAWQARATININVNAVQKTVVFIYASDANGGVDRNKPLGTGFLVGVPTNTDPNKFYSFLLTARHMLDPTWAKCPQVNPTVIYARLNKSGFVQGSADSGLDFVRIQLTERGMPTWSHHPSNDIDAAVIPIAIDQNQFDVQYIPVELFPTDAEISAQSVGDPIMSAGLLPGLTGNTRNHPIFKFGQISNIPTEDIETRCAQQAPPFQVKVWLIAANLVPGNSGSPIFHVPLGGGGVTLGGTRPMILGVQSISFLGADVAGMTPISFVYEILRAMAPPDSNFRRGPLPNAAQR